MLPVGSPCVLFLLLLLLSTLILACHIACDSHVLPTNVATRIAATIASFLDQNALDSLARTCRQVRASLLPNRKPLLASTLRCCNEDLPVDAEETLRYRARAGNWFYMEDQARTTYDTKSGLCARDMVAGCRRCGTVVCRVCSL